MSELSEKIVDFLKVIGEQTRFEILDLLRSGQKTSEDIQNALNKKQSTISLQLKKLYAEDIISVKKKGSRKFYNIKHQYILKILSLVQSFVINIQKKKAKKFVDLDVYDTLSSRHI